MLKHFIWNCLERFDSVFNHGFIDKVFNLFGDNDLSFWIWEHTSRRFCKWVVIDLYDKWFPNNTY